MVIAPPSVRPGIGAYRWVNNAPIADAPDWLIELATASDRSNDANGHDRSPPRASREEIIAALKAIPSEVYQTWFEIGAAIRHELGAGGRELFHEWSRKSKKYDAQACEEKWFALADVTGYSGGTIFHYANASNPAWRETAMPALGFLDMRTWDSEPAPPREWAIETACRRAKPGCFQRRGWHRQDRARNDEERSRT